LNKQVSYIDAPRDAPFEPRLTLIARAAAAAGRENFVHSLRVERPLHLQRAPPESTMINETSFFRDFLPFELLRQSILPKLIELKREERRLTVWSASSSTGQEAYSLAITLCEYFPELADWDAKIIATDPSEASIEYARRGCYRRLEVNRGLPVRLLMKYFARAGEEWQISAKVRSMVEFRSTDLRASLRSLPQFDLVLLRNVLLYFPQHDRGRVLSGVYRMMHPHGALLLGDAEQADDSTDLFGEEFEAGCYYYRPKAGIKN
jgi:chemotaxis protein methyltransferase CheR